MVCAICPRRKAFGGEGSVKVAEAKVTLVTAGGRRVGAAIVRELHAAGDRIIIHCRESREAAEALAAELNALRPDSVDVLQANLKEATQREALIAHATQRWGRLDALVNNASTFYPSPVGTVTEAIWDDLVDVNLKAPFFLAQAAYDALAQSRGAIVNIVDIYAERPLEAYPVYSIAKAGLLALTRSLARELAPEVRVNAVSPGAILWPEAPVEDQEKEKILSTIPMGERGHPSDIAKTVRFFLKDAPYITGQVLAVDGGRTLSL